MMLVSDRFWGTTQFEKMDWTEEDGYLLDHYHEDGNKTLQTFLGKMYDQLYHEEDGEISICDMDHMGSKEFF